MVEMTSIRSTQQVTRFPFSRNSGFVFVSAPVKKSLWRFFNIFTHVAEVLRAPQVDQPGCYGGLPKSFGWYLTSCHLKSHGGPSNSSTTGYFST